jgi:hypothetical protein
VQGIPGHEIQLREPAIHGRHDDANVRTGPLGTPEIVLRDRVKKEDDQWDDWMAKSR